MKPFGYLKLAPPSLTLWMEDVENNTRPETVGLNEYDLVICLFQVTKSSSAQEE